MRSSWTGESDFNLHGCWQETLGAQWLFIHKKPQFLLGGSLIRLPECPPESDQQVFLRASGPAIVVWLGEVREINPCMNIVKSG